MSLVPVSRRNFVRFATAGALAAAAPASFAQEAGANPLSTEKGKLAYQEESRARRLAWWQQARFGMFIHYGLYSIIGQQEWVMESEGIPIPQYEMLAQHFMPKPGCAREWAQLARRAGQKYMVLTAKHHEGFCLWDTTLTNYNSAQTAGRDMVREFVEAARAEGLRVGLYYSLMDWHHPDGAICKTDEAARRRFVDYTHGLIRELMTNYGKIDVLWYDVAWPLDAEQWESERMNEMVFSLQPDIIVNNRNRLEGDFATPEQHIQASEAGRAWETCMTLNDSWGFNRGDDAWKTPKEIVDNLATCARGGGNYLLNIGPEPDGSVPPPSVEILEQVGRWLDTNGEAIYRTERGDLQGNNNCNLTRRGNTLYIHQHFWPGHTPAAEWLSFYQPEVVVAIGGVKPKALSARLLKTGQKVEFTQDEFTLRLTGLPMQAPDQPATVIEVECDGEPVISHEAMRPLWPRNKVGISV